jgi:hypothetical protein
MRILAVDDDPTTLKMVSVGDLETGIPSVAEAGAEMSG